MTLYTPFYEIKLGLERMYNFIYVIKTNSILSSDASEFWHNFRERNLKIRQKYFDAKASSLEMKFC